MEKDKINGVMLVGDLRTRLMYRSRESMAVCWKEVYPNQLLPDDHVQVETGKIKTFLESLAKPQRGRSASITNAAVSMLEEINAPKHFEAEQVEIQAVEMPLPAISEQEKALKTVAENKGIWQEIRNTTALDMVFYINMLIADYGFFFLFKEMGLAAGSVYTLVSFHALRMAKNRYSQVTAERGISAVWALELIAFCIHLAMFNIRAWQAGKAGKLPFSVWENATYAFWVAVVLALLFSGAAIYSVSTTLALTKERVEAENYEERHGMKY